MLSLHIMSSTQEALALVADGAVEMRSFHINGIDVFFKR